MRKLLAGLALCAAATVSTPSVEAAAKLVGGFTVTVTRGHEEGHEVELNNLFLDTALFHFGDLHQPEVLVSVVNGCSHNGHHWVKVAAATDLAADVLIAAQDGVTWRARLLEGHSSRSFFDITAFPCRYGATSAMVAAPAASSRGGDWLHDGRFLAGFYVTKPDGSDRGTLGIDLPGESAALLYAFSQHSPEALVRVVNGCSVNGHWWVFMALTTDLPAVARVQDTGQPDGQLPGIVRHYTIPAGSLDGVADRTAFPCDGSSPVPPPSDPEPPPTGDAPCNAAGEGINLLGHQLFMCIVANGEVHQLPAQKLSDKVAVFGRRSDPKAIVKLVSGCTWGAIAAVTTARKLQIRIYNTDNGKEWEHNHNASGLAPSGYAGNALCDEAQ